MHNCDPDEFIWSTAEYRVKRWLWDVRAAIAVFLIIGVHFESDLPDRQGELNYFLIDHSFPRFRVKLTKAWTSVSHIAVSVVYQL